MQVVAAQSGVVEAPQPEEAMEGARELRGSCLRLLAQMLERFPNTVDYNFMWPRFFAAVTPLLPRIPTEVRTNFRTVTNSSRAPFLTPPPQKKN